jgi:uncharacterized ion transporter superfamily protein YfcC
VDSGIKEKKRSYPNALILLMGLIVLVAVMSFIVPSGQYSKIEVDGRSVIDPDGYHTVEKKYIGLLDFLTVIPQGMQAASTVIFLILLIGATVHIVNTTNAASGAVALFSQKFGKERGYWILIVLFLFFDFLGAYAGMIDPTIAFAPLTITIALSLGYDVITGLAVTIVGIVVGWSAGPVNIFTAGIGQNLAGLRLFSGFWYRNLVLLVLTSIALLYLLYYAAKVRKNPEKSVVYGLEGIPTLESMGGSVEEVEFTPKRKIVLGLFIATIALIAWGSFHWKWGMTEMGAVYFACGLGIGAFYGYGLNELADKAVQGMTIIFPGTLAVGVARGLSVLMEKAGIIDTIIYWLASPLRDMSTAVVSVGMLLLQSVINFFIPSGTGQAMATLPIMLPVSDILGVSKQVAILAFQLGDGLSNMCYPTVALLIGCLVYAKIPFSRWMRFIMPYLILSWLASAALLYYASSIGWGADHFLPIN